MATASCSVTKTFRNYLLKLESQSQEHAYVLYNIENAKIYYVWNMQNNKQCTSTFTLDRDTVTRLCSVSRINIVVNKGFLDLAIASIKAKTSLRSLNVSTWTNSLPSWEIQCNNSQKCFCFSCSLASCCCL